MSSHYQVIDKLEFQFAHYPLVKLEIRESRLNNFNHNTEYCHYQTSAAAFIVFNIRPSFEGMARLYELRGQIFFSSSEKFMQGFDFKEDVKDVIIDLTHSHIWDVTSVAMLDSVVKKFQKNGVNVTVRGLNEASSIMIDKYGTHARI